MGALTRDSGFNVLELLPIVWANSLVGWLKLGLSSLHLMKIKCWSSYGMLYMRQHEILGLGVLEWIYRVWATWLPHHYISQKGVEGTPVTKALVSSLVRAAPVSLRSSVAALLCRPHRLWVMPPWDIRWPYGLSFPSWTGCCLTQLAVFEHKQFIVTWKWHIRDQV